MLISDRTLLNSSKAAYHKNSLASNKSLVCTVYGVISIMWLTTRLLIFCAQSLQDWLINSLTNSTTTSNYLMSRNSLNTIRGLIFYRTFWSHNSNCQSRRVDSAFVSLKTFRTPHILLPCVRAIRTFKLLFIADPISNPLFRDFQRSQEYWASDER